MLTDRGSTASDRSKNPRGWQRVGSLTLLVAIVFLPSSCTDAELAAGPVRLAVASNFVKSAEALARRYEKATSRRVVISSGSTGKLFAQIVNGAPFDVLLAADAERPRVLEERALAVAGSRFTYALGRLVLWSPRAGMVDAQGRVLEGETFRHLAIANPDLAPYGRAAREVLEARGVWDRCAAKCARGENIGQAMHFVASGGADMGLVARSQLVHLASSDAGSRWDVPQDLHGKIEQQAVLLRDGAAARGFLDYLRGAEAQALIRGFGYGVHRAERR